MRKYRPHLSRCRPQPASEDRHSRTGSAAEARDGGGLPRARQLQRSASERTRPSQPLGGRTLRMNAMVRARSTTSESPYFPGLTQLGPYIASGTLVSYDHGEPWVEA